MRQLYRFDYNYIQKPLIVFRIPDREAYHTNLINALVKDNWSITDDPYFMRWGTRDMYVDLGASLLVAAEKEEVKIAVELKSFTGLSPYKYLY